MTGNNSTVGILDLVGGAVIGEDVCTRGAALYDVVYFADSGRAAWREINTCSGGIFHDEHLFLSCTGAPDHMARTCNGHRSIMDVSLYGSVDRFDIPGIR